MAFIEVCCRHLRHLSALHLANSSEHISTNTVCLCCYSLKLTSKVTFVSLSLTHKLTTAFLLSQGFDASEKGPWYTNPVRTVLNGKRYGGTEVPTPDAFGVTVGHMVSSPTSPQRPTPCTALSPSVILSHTLSFCVIISHAHLVAHNAIVYFCPFTNRATSQALTFTVVFFLLSV